MTTLRSRFCAVLGMALALGMLAAQPADARRGGSFGSRGSRTYSAPRSTATAPGYTAPVQRSMTAPGSAPGGAYAPGPGTPGYVAGSPYGYGAGPFGGFRGGGFLGGLVAGGPIGGGFGGGPAPGAPFVPTTGPAWEIPIEAADQAAFETLLKEIQDAFGREDYAGLRERCTPEVMGYLAEELSDNATHGKKNEVTGTRLLQADVGEAWRENDIDYATAAMRYESIDLMRDRTSGAVLSGDPNTPSQTTELWTFARHIGGPWKLSAIQDAH
jgi:predicted lipid-binding transport protein (Tim44 family)